MLWNPFVLFQIWDCVKFMTILTLCSAMFQFPNMLKFPYCLRGFLLRGINRPQAQVLEEWLRGGPSTNTELKQTSRSQKSKEYSFKRPAKILITPFLIYFFKYFNLIYKIQTHKLTIFPLNLALIFFISLGFLFIIYTQIINS